MYGGFYGDNNARKKNKMRRSYIYKKTVGR